MPNTACNGNDSFGHICSTICLSKTHAIRLRELEKEGILERQVHNETTPRVECRLTTKAQGLVESIMQLLQWDEKMVIKAIGLVVCHALNEHFMYLRTEVVPELVLSF
jgi:DNA-binding HxlR family transcriptional regulator